jgi:hypothetical protein
MQPFLRSIRDIKYEMWGAVGTGLNSFFSFTFSNDLQQLARTSYILEWRMVFFAVDNGPIKAVSYFRTNSHN